MVTQSIENILKALKSEHVVLWREAVFMHPCDVIRVVEQLNQLRTSFSSPDRHSGTVTIFDMPVDWEVKFHNGHVKHIVLSMD